LTGLLLCLVAAVWFYLSYTQPRAGVKNEVADYKLNATDLYKEFATDEEAANKKYNGKIISVTGKFIDIQKEKEALLMVIEGEGGGGISCRFSPPLPLQIPELQQTVTIKGRCTGFLMDVNLVDAVLVP